MSNAVESKVLSGGEAGHSGADIRSDLHVRIEPRELGGIAVELESRVKPYYGDSIRRQAEEVLEALGVRHAAVKIHDEGALPFVIAARIEAAVRRAGLGAGTRVLPDRIPFPSRLREIVSGVRGSMFPAASLSISSTRPFTGPMASSSIWKIQCMESKRMLPDCWCGMRCAPLIFCNVNAWCGLTSFRSGWKIWTKLCRNLLT